jgi:Flp pilus assembly protein TadG
MRVADHRGAVMKRLHVRTSSRTRGQALAELALVLPVFLLLTLAVFDIGRGVFLYVGLTNAAREGARLAIVNQDKALISDRIAASICWVRANPAIHALPLPQPNPDIDNFSTLNVRRRHRLHRRRSRRRSGR